MPEAPQVFQPVKKPPIIPTTEPPSTSSAPAPDSILQSHDNEPDENQQWYNLRSQAQEIANSVIEPHLIPYLSFHIPGDTFSHG